jgi:phytanoyl-CoA hydroxylase
MVIPGAEADSYRTNGYAMARGFFRLDEVSALIEHYMRLREADSYAGDFSGVDAADDDPLKSFPRMIHMHRWDQISLDWMIDERIASWLEQLTGQPAFAV